MHTPTSVLSSGAVQRALSVRDLSDPGQGRHALQLVVEETVAALRRLWPATETRVVREHPVVSLADNYWRLGYEPDAVTLDARYTRYVDDDHVLRSHTSAMIPPALDDLAAANSEEAGVDVLLVCPGISYRRDAVDRLHTGTPHQLDVWRITNRGALGEADLQNMIGAVVAGALPSARWRTLATGHPYTTAGRQIDAAQPRGAWVEIGECGLTAPHVLRSSGLDPKWTGLAMGLGLDRLLMLRKDVPDIRLLRSADPRIAAQMTDLTPYRPVSTLPPVRRDLSVAVDEDADASAEALGDVVREALGDDADAAESVTLLAETGYADVPGHARERLGMRPGQRNLLVRVVLRPWDRTLTDGEANALRDRIYAALHSGAGREPRRV